MGRKSKVDRIPAEARKALQRWLAEPAISQAEATEALNELLAEMGHTARLTVSSVNRYAQRMSEVGKRLKERHEVAEMWVERFGRLPQGQLGQLIVQMVQGVAFDVGVKLGEMEEVDADKMPALVRMLRDMSVMLERTERASTMNARREAEIKREAAAAAADAAAVESRRQGVSAPGIESLRAAIMEGLAG